MESILRDFSARGPVKKAIKTNWENYHYCLGRSPSVELSIGRYLTWLITSMPDHFLNLVICTQLPSSGTDQLIDDALAHFRARNIKKLSWLTREGLPSTRLRQYLLERGLTLRESFATEMAVDLASVAENIPVPEGLKILRVETGELLKQWIHVASIGFKVPEQYERVWYDFFVEAVFDLPFWSYLGVLDGKPVATSQLFLSAGVAGIYNVTCIPEARGRGIGAALTQAALLDAGAIGYRVGILQASELGYGVYRRLGFQDFGKLSVFLWENK